MTLMKNNIKINRSEKVRLPYMDIVDCDVYAQGRPERILSAAVWSNETGIVYCGFRHHVIIAQINQIYNDSSAFTKMDCIHGFLTSHGNFVDRKTAFDIALEQKQIINNDNTRNGYLFSEDLY